MNDELILLPYPRQLTYLPEKHNLESGKLIILGHSHPHELRLGAGRFQEALQAKTGLVWETVADTPVPAEQVGLTLNIAPHNSSHPQGYELQITPQSLLIEAHDEPGIYYGVCTLVQLIQSLPAQSTSLPCLHIVDWPDFPQRGVMLDISRDKVPTLDTTLALIDRLSSWKINQFQLYVEHTFAYRQHPEVWADASPFTGEEMLILDAYCQERYIDFVPNQNSFGHMHRWLTHPRYQHLAETPDGFVYPWGKVSKGPFSLCPLDPGSLDLVRSLYDELLPHFSSQIFNVGCDETFDLGQGRSKDACEQRGRGRVYLDFLLQIYQEVSRRGRTMQFWGDIINQHPELVPELPYDCIALEWGYDADHPFDQNCARFAQAGLEFYVCPGTSSWTSIAGRTDNAIGNLRSAAENGLKHGAAGYLNTDWGDDGHWQTLPVSYLGFAAGAAYSWALDSNRDIDVAQALSLYAFEDPTSCMGRAAYDLGNIYRAVGVEPGNSSALFWLLHQPLGKARDFQETISADALYHTLDAIAQAAAPLSRSQSARPDAALLQDEFRLAIRMLQHAVHRALLAQGVSQFTKTGLNSDLLSIIDEYQRIWLLRNRSGGLKDSLALLERSRQDYYM